VLVRALALLERPQDPVERIVWVPRLAPRAVDCQRLLRQLDELLSKAVERLDGIRSERRLDEEKGKRERTTRSPSKCSFAFSSCSREKCVSACAANRAVSSMPVTEIGVRPKPMMLIFPPAKSQPNIGSRSTCTPGKNDVVARPSAAASARVASLAAYAGESGSSPPHSAGTKRRTPAA
jgi:hypothetical protein